MKRKLKTTVISYLFLLPFLLVFAVFLVWPVIYSFFLSLHKVPVISNLYDTFASLKFVGFSNYLNILKDIDFWWSILMTFYYAILTIPTSIVLSLLLAIILSNALIGKKFFRSAFFLPMVLDMLVVGIIWVLIYDPNFGVLNTILNKIGIGTFNERGFLSNPYLAMPSIAFAMVLKGLGFGMVLFLAAIQNIPSSIYEAAEVDGASTFDKLIHITIPLVKPIILFLIVTGIMASLNAFTEIYAMTNATGGPNIVIGNKTLGATTISGFYLWKKFDFAEYGYAAALSYVLLIFALTLTYLNIKFIRYET